MSRGLALCVSPVQEPLPNDMLGIVTLDLDPVNRRRSTVGRLGPSRTGRPGRYVRARYLFIYMLCEVEKLNIRTLCFGVQAGVDYGMPELVPMTPFKDPDFVC
ncbi:hypothetical protein M9H77_35999 [Catharanthus roseus]|uniref:Uncharacterized protein n=1 Tax=Catharanthus roseus TaxID=4058 RepID=A0ACB9ZSC1_CATRO|nr:hypothetical protein M9H77_35999 [Catharanthus roseus]